MPRAPTAAELRMVDLERQRERAREWASRMGLLHNTTGSYNREHDRREAERRNTLMNPLQIQPARINIPTAATGILNAEHDYNMENRGGKIKKSRKNRKSRKTKQNKTKQRKSRKQRHRKSRK